MPRYIDADILKDLYQPIDGKDYNVNMAIIRANIDDTPTADVQEVRHGKWIVQHRHVRYPSGKSYDVDVDVCPFCGRKDHNGDGLYCGYCGAMMDGE